MVVLPPVPRKEFRLCVVVILLVVRMKVVLVSQRTFVGIVLVV